MKLLKPNIGTAGRLLRLVVGILLLIYAYWAGSWIALAASLFVFFEVAASWCVVYHFLGKDSCDIEKR